jgi:hypothetical protein
MRLADMDDYTRGSEEELLAWYIADQVCAQASGRDQDECTQNFPHDRFFIGNLRPVRPEEEEDAFRGASELFNKLAPVAFGAEFRVQPQDSTFIVWVRLHWACYYRVFPTFKQQLEHQKRQTVEEERETSGNLQAENEIEAVIEETTDTDDNRPGSSVSPEVTETVKDRRRSREAKDSLFIRFKKIKCEAVGAIHIRIDTNDAEWLIDIADLQNAIDAELQQAQAVALADPDNLRTAGGPDDSVQVPETVLQDLSGQAYYNFCRALNTQVVPEWAWKVEVTPRLSDVTDDLSERLLMIRFTNITPVFKPRYERTSNFETFMFEVEAGFAFERCESLPFEFALAPRGFRYDPYILARGFNCNIRRADENDSVQLVTTTVPLYRQLRYQTQTQPAAQFADLARDPIPVLEAILVGMQEYLGDWEQGEQYYSAQSWWNTAYQAEYDRDRKVFEQEIERFRAGLELIRDNADVRLAFQLTNETFRRGPKKAWRLFQIVFLVSQIPGIAVLADPTLADPAERRVVDIIYFPTGGGKTEAYLAVIVFHCFFDRLRGKKAGITAWTRFPLRLLTLQQTQRVADVIGLAELVRREQTQEPRLSGRGVAGFAVGYFVGSNATPNKLSPPYPGQIGEPDWEIAQDPDERQRWKRIVTCPSCRTNTVIVDFDEKAVRLRHRCTQPNCRFENGYLPVYVVDNEVYRYLPSVVVGTIDKLAGIGNQAKMSLMLGQVEGRCKLHGYYAGKCSQDECDDPSQLVREVPEGLSGPTLFVQDELHLLTEGLGTFDSHYETFVQRLMQEFGQTQPIKIIASSATIEAFQRQVEHLYGRAPEEARVFPGLGPQLGASFYAQTLKYPQRLFIGIIPHNKTIFNSILELIQYYHEVIQDLQNLSSNMPNPYGGTILPGTQDWKQLLDWYATSITYFLATRDLHSIKTDLEAAVIPDLEQKGYRPLLISELTGSVGTSEVAATLERLERKSPPPPDVVLATNMISHGVDVDYLNAIVFYGMPARVAEYIQSSSRVGRTHVGLVFMCLHPAHERDQSHYIYFSKFHEFLGQLIEPVAINRWSRFSVTRTLPGLFMATMLQLLASRSGQKSRGLYTRLDFVKKQIRDGAITFDDFIPLLEEAYQVVEIDSPAANAFREEIRLRVEQFFDQIVNAGAHIEWVSDALIPPPMRSLRDVDEQLLVELDDNGTRWASPR